MSRARLFSRGPLSQPPADGVNWGHGCRFRYGYLGVRGVERVLAGIRRLTALADGVADPDAIFRALARELLATPGAEEVHIHHLARNGAVDDLVDVYLFEAEGRVSYLSPRAERPPGVSWVARTRRSFLAA